MARFQGEPIIENAEEAFEHASEMMRSSGFKIDQEIQVAVDNKLEIMGYTLPERNGNLIVVSENALKSGFVEGLLVHEMSHIYRSSTMHPSHSEKAMASIMNSFRKKFNRTYQREALNNILNHIEDLYADDIAFMVLLNSKAVSPWSLGRFLQGWIREKPASSDNHERDRWINAVIMLNNAFALSNMERHSIPDIDFRGRDANLKFLYAINPKAAEHFGYFSRFMVKMREDIDERMFKEMMLEYIREFTEVVKAL